MTTTTRAPRATSASAAKPANAPRPGSLSAAEIRQIVLDILG